MLQETPYDDAGFDFSSDGQASPACAMVLADFKKEHRNFRGGVSECAFCLRMLR